METTCYTKLKYCAQLTVVVTSDILVVVLALSPSDNGLDICLLFRSSLGAECAAVVCC